jgi:2-oxo-4-hydroxy-4-carboxy-5-ureidoimidazoline decarboxylase
MTLDEINALDPEQFVAALGGLFEGSPWIATLAWKQRPFTNAQALHDALGEGMYMAARDQQIALIRAHPDLAGKAALSGTLGAASTSEQAAAGLNRLTADELARFTQLNTGYREKFGFPFVICARLLTKEEILQAFARRLNNSAEQELSTALDEIGKISMLRLRDMLDPSEF